MERQRAALQDNTYGLQPEKALVLETIGPIQDFIKAVKIVEGLEWMGELEVDEIPPAYGFEDKKDPEKKLKGRLFLFMTDQRALEELQRLFHIWEDNSEAKFPRGLAPLKKAFVHLYDIRPWNAEDRIRETGLLEDWRFRLEHDQSSVPFEAELWFRDNPARRRQGETLIREVVVEAGGEVLGQCIIPQIAYHAVLGNIPNTRAEAVLRRNEVRLLHCEDVMFLRPVGQCAAILPEIPSEAETPEAEGPGRDRPEALPAGNPLIALFDGLPLTRHRSLEGRIVVDDPDGYETDYPAGDRKHGTAMASLICRGDLNETGSPLPRPVYVRPILRPRRDLDGGSWESIPEDVLPVDLVHRAVRRLFETEGDEPPTAPTVRVINLSIGDPARPLDLGMSPWARLLDWLSWRYNVLFVVSAGNHPRNIELEVPRTGLRDLTDEEREAAVIRAIAADTRHRRLLSPAETLNGLTVGAAHADSAGSAPSPHLLDPFVRMGIPSTVSAHGPGYRKAIKPEVLLPGGRQFLSEKMGTSHTKAVLVANQSTRPPGQRVAGPGPQGRLDRTLHSRGTSNAAALASRSAAYLWEIVEELRFGLGLDLPTEYDAVLLKALLIHGADWGKAGELYASLLRNNRNGRVIRDVVGRFLGYGSADVGKAAVCTEQRATLLGVGQLEDGEGDVFSLPLPPSLSARTEKRRLTVTIAWFSAIAPARQEYRVAHLWFNPKNRLAGMRTNADHRAVQRGTVQHEVLEDEKAVDFQDGEEMVIQVNCRAEAGDIVEPVRYALAATLEVGEEIDLSIYTEIRDRLRVRIPVRSKEEL